MCRGKQHCSEIPNDPKLLDLRSPLRPPKWLNSQIEIFAVAVREFINGNRDICLDIINSLRGDEFCNWYIEHGQNSGRFRVKIINAPNPIPIPEDERDPLRAPKKYQEEVFKRDGYRCRYCGNKLISQKSMKEFIKQLNSDEFIKGSTNLTTHGLIHATWPVADHVFPWNLGGVTSPSNLVASCASCNYGKANFTTEQLGIENPLNFDPIIDQWDGLSSLINEIKNA